MKMFEGMNIPLLGKALDTYATRQRVIAANVANVNTVGYKSKQVSFEEQLNTAMQGSNLTMVETNERHIGGAPASGALPEARVVEVASGPDAGDPRINGINDVDVDHEMAEMATNQIRFRFASRLLSEAFRGLEKSIRGQV